MDPNGTFPRVTSGTRLDPGWRTLGVLLPTQYLGIIVQRVGYLLPITSIVDNDEAVLIRCIGPATLILSGLP